MAVLLTENKIQFELVLLPFKYLCIVTPSPTAMFGQTYHPNFFVSYMKFRLFCETCRLLL
jgi:hypothetical protein